MYSKNDLKNMRHYYELLYNHYVENKINKIEKVSPYSEKINLYIQSLNELNVYLNLRLEERTITRPSLVLDVDLAFVNSRGETNLDRLKKGRAPYDCKTGEIIELHHIGQKFDSPFAELPRMTHIGTATYSILHETNIESWRLDKEKVSVTNAEITQYWKTRMEGLL